MKCNICGYKTDNAKSFSNHTRYGCNNTYKPDVNKCSCCGNKLPKRKPSQQGRFCNRECYFKWRRRSGFVGKNATNYKTGESRTRLYATWLGIKRRCTKTNCKDYHNYGGRGITICSEWNNDFLAFKRWANDNGYNDTLTIERVDVNGNYCPQNCTWIPIGEQAKNKRNSRNGK